MAKELRGKPVADALRAQLEADIEAWRARDVTPRMVTVLVEGDPASLCYARAKGRVAAKLGVAYEVRTLPGHVTQAQLIQFIQSLNRDPAVHGVMLELPLPKHLSADEVLRHLSPIKDVDGLTPANQVATVSGAPGIYPATPQACIRLLKHYGYTLAGRHVALVGCGKTVGMPLFHLLVREGATVTVCHAGTPDLTPHLKRADIAFVAVGKAGLIRPQMVHPGLVVVDAGINESDDGIVGDVSPETAAIVAALTPTPGGVGAVTTMQLFTNLLQAMHLQQAAGILNVPAAV
ncbi:MAG: bifunctional 5,10-methylenetetrahydrofolate dehydrogenase/5,10-methenyltetrahydrofolate cyclohydrolase [Alicyclobacillus macrosporangiidus]|uniref:bifunctional 5,10-methylenetetrahydrofolate dehydrogenase/5,10-methenyltetrahydrofolate cyclohydrolase n=1 Tax=Alicyclobacillus macrosporangiidus TaxID=392015 RepID=UPI0026EAE08A|nr:bifunctional 5,10-methylenetetrahydrofolate dehydrogenase/5,10-methenyltetrahydrofolate cyclohydrolase [Alicyclobacillus macrosporangiidus]MCL6599647.1 bifunctional 5,10-methylenetetrahydrofolate dehydrogenase/5,10-methenyltetrahydrofolate cyclohydrolase [Alicyclobacillus macrosporangiidus]